MVNLYSGFISCKKQANISAVADHFDHIKEVGGPESIGIGGDFDGATSFPLGLEDVSKYPALIQELLQRNWSESELAGVLRLNFLRVFEEVEKVRDQLHRTLPSEVQIPLEEVQNPCRLVLKPSGSGGPQSNKSILSGAVILAAVLLLSSLLTL
ncbi:hypothetical protein LDENG_00180230 [Lucifuga dentata]|nr:hypothetical protein LDENG_00180230 [Lucifuga dentata]